MKILITGASGFIGSFLVEEALHRGFETWAAVRPTSSRRYLADPRIHFIELDLSDPARLRGQLRGHTWDYVVHAAGVTKCAHEADFARVNTEGTRHLAEALADECPGLRRMVYLSSLSVMGAVREAEPHTDISPTDTPKPNTAYGRSKLEAEQCLDAMAGRIDTVTLRPTGVYGPRERDYFLMVQSIARHVDFAAGLRPQDITFIYVRDVVQAAFLALDHGPRGAKYFLTDGRVYRSADFSRLVRRELGGPWCLRITAPLWLLRVVTTAGELWGRATGRMTALNRDKYSILSQRNWRCDTTEAQAQLGFRPEWPLERGVAEAVRWYRDNGWV